MIFDKVIVMKNISKVLTGMIWLGATCALAQAAGGPKIQFDQVLYDFGKTSRVATVSGVFKFKNVGDAVLQLQPPKPSCGCTVAELKPDTLAPGASGELPFTLSLGQFRSLLEKHISVLSNDPLTPDVSLTIRVDYTPLFDLNPITVAPNLAFGVDTDEQFTTLVRSDGKPMRITRMEASKPWITATAEPDAKSNDTARIRITVKREGAPRHFAEYVQVYTAEQTNTPASSIYVYGQFEGEVSLTPEALYWSIADDAKNNERPEATILRRLTIRSSNAQGLQLKNPQSTIKGLKVELVPKEAGKVYELVARLDEVPASTVSGNVSFETSVADQPRIEIPVIVNVFKQ
jgi:hypothetical protein